MKEPLKNYLQVYIAGGWEYFKEILEYLEHFPEEVDSNKAFNSWEIGWEHFGIWISFGGNFGMIGKFYDSNRYI